MHGRHKKLNIAILCINIVLLLIFAVLYGTIYSLNTRYSPDNAKRLWDNDTYSYSQISLYLTPSSGLDIMSVYSLRSEINSKLKENSVQKADENSDGRLWIDSSCGECSFTVTGNTGSCEAAASGTWGDYFIFHPETLLSGSYYNNDDINFDRVILDKQCSWQLFGAIDTAGMTVKINDMNFYVAAVVDTSENERDIAAYGSKPRIYMPFEAMKILNPDAVITSYEVCLPNVVKDFAYTVMQDVNPAPESSSIIIDQTGRFGLIKLFTGFGDIPKSVMIDKNLSYPWFENRIRGAEIIAKIMAGFAVYILIIPAISVVYGIFLIVKLIGAGARAIAAKADRAYQKKISAAYYRKHPRT